MRLLVTELSSSVLRDMQRQLLPGHVSETGFIAPGEDLVEVVTRDLRSLGDLGVTPARIADRLASLVEQGHRRAEHDPAARSALNRGAKKAISVGDRFELIAFRYCGFQDCPFGCRDGWDIRDASRDYFLHNARNRHTLGFPGLSIHLIRDHHFFEGNVPHRVDPARAVKVLELAAEPFDCTTPPQGIGEDPPSDISGLIGALDEADAGCWNVAIMQVAAIGADAVPALVHALENAGERARVGAVRALRRIGRAAEPAGPVLIQVLRAETRPGSMAQSVLHSEVATALGVISARGAVPVLIRALQNRSHLCVCAALALGQLEDESAVSPLVEVLMDQDASWVPRCAAAVALGRLGKLAEPAVPSLTTALEFKTAAPGEHWDPRAREAVADALARIADPAAASASTNYEFQYEIWRES